MRSWLKIFFGIGGNPITHSQSEQTYSIKLTITKEGCVQFPTPTGASWSDVSMKEIEQGRIEVSVGTATSLTVGHDWKQGPDREARRREEAAHERGGCVRVFSLESLGLTETYGKDAAGKALIELLRAKGKLRRPAYQKDKAMTELNAFLVDFLNIDGSPFEYQRDPGGGSWWIANFKVASPVSST